MLGSYGLLGIFVYCEHKAGPSPTRLFWVPVLLSVDHVKINGDIHTDQEAREKQEEEEEEEVVVYWWVTVVHLKRGAPRLSSRELSSTLSQTQVTKQG